MRDLFLQPLNLPRLKSYVDLLQEGKPVVGSFGRLFQRIDHILKASEEVETSEYWY